jgi:hypothetical protein
MLCPHSEDLRGILIEFKKGDLEELEILAEKALMQIQERDYLARFRKLRYKGPVLCYGIASHKKEIFVKMEVLLS